jgi:LysR family glycine cleavage system transcriptional activator
MSRSPPLNALRVFSTAARVGSFTKASEELCVTQGAVSRQVKLVEAALATPLFMRVHQSVVLTPAGADLAASLEQAFELIENAVTRTSKFRQRQLLKVNLPPTFATRWLAPRLSDFRCKHPLIDLSITTDVLQYPRQVRHQDCLVVFGQQAWSKTRSELLMQEDHVVVSSPDLWGCDVPPSLSSSTLLHVLDGDQRLPIWEHWIQANKITGVDTRPGLNFSTLDQAINAAVSGAGLVIVDKAMIVRELKSGALKRLNQQQLKGPCGYWFVNVSKQPDRQALVAGFHDWLFEQIELSQADRMAD